MHICLLICNESAVVEYVLTDTENCKENTETIHISKDTLIISDDLHIQFQQLANSVRFLKKSNCNFKACSITWQNEREILLAVTQSREKIWICATRKQKMHLYKIKCVKANTVISIGRDRDNTIVLCTDEMLSSHHVNIEKRGKGACLKVSGKNGIYLNGYHINCNEETSLLFADEIQFFGWKLVWLESCVIMLGYMEGEYVEHLNQDVNDIDRRDLYSDLSDPEQHDDNKITHATEWINGFEAAPRNMIALDKEPVELESPPVKQELEEQPLLLTIGPAFTMAIPVLLGFVFTFAIGRQTGGFMMYTGLITTVSSGIFGGLWAFLNVHHRKKRVRQAEQKRRNAYQDYVSECESRIQKKYLYNRNILRTTYPPIQDIIGADINTLLLWNRREQDADMLKCRLGTGSHSCEVPVIIPKERFALTEDFLNELPQKLKEKYAMLNDVPICIDLSEETVHGVVCSRKKEMMELVRILALQLGSACCPAIVSMMFLINDKGEWEQERQWLKWLPHIWTEAGNLMATEKERVWELVERLEEYLNKPETIEKKHIVIFTDSFETVSRILALDNGGHTTVIVFTEDYRCLPNCCHSIIQRGKVFSGLISMKSGKTARTEVHFDSIGCREAQQYARRLCSLGFSYGESAQIPSKVTIFELYGLTRPDWHSIDRSWKSSRSESNLSVEIGLGADGRRCFLDAHERAHGPHGLIAGMTGSGKSEMLQTIILSLAMKYAPVEVVFFLIDYKGGGMASLFAGLPHLLGSISNLSGSMIYRAMVSIRSENERRQRIFLEHAVNQIYEYQKLYRIGKVTVPLPHIFIIIDEFAELKREEPEFMRELISVAQVGRSLGMHLILSTQKPAGTVDDNIWSNSRFRICLRVQDRQDSNDMLHRADAAYISNPGRAFLQIGNDEMFMMFQGAYTMEPYEPNARTGPIAVRMTHNGIPTGTKTLSRAEHLHEKKETQIGKLLCEISLAAKHTEYRTVDSLWLLPLPDELYLENTNQDFSIESFIEKKKEDELYSRYQTEVGRYDHPRQQRQGMYELCFAKGGHHVICGTAASGKSTFLQTILYSLIMKETPETLHIYMIDYSSRLMLGFADSRLVGGVLTEDEQEELPKLFCLLTDRLTERKRRLQGGSFLQYTEKQKNLLPAILLVIDNYGSFREKTGGCFDMILQELAKVGENYGIYLLLTASGVGNSELPGRIFENCRTGICLTMNDKYQYCEILRTMQLEHALPEKIKGRGLAWIDGTILEFQCALCLRAESDFERLQMVQKEMNSQNNKYQNRRASPIPKIPKKPMLNDFIERLESTEIKKGELPIGYEERSGKICTVPLMEIKHMLITGKRKTGKRNFMTVLKKLAGKYGVSFECIDSVEQLERSIRKNETAMTSMEVMKSKEFCYLYLIENLGDVLNKYYVNNFRTSEERNLIEILQSKGLHKIIATVENESMVKLRGRRLFEELAETAYGVHMGGALDQQSFFDVSYLSFSQQSVLKKSGRGTIIKSSEHLFYGDIVLPLADE